MATGHLQPTWSCGRAPQNGDTIYIPLGRTVTVNINTPNYTPFNVFIDGILNFDNGAKLNFCNGSVVLSATAQLTGGNPGSKIDYCGATVWNGPGPTSGPTYYGQNPLPVELLFFTGSANENGNIELKWATASEQNNHYFTLERSVNGISFTEVARAEGHGTTSQRNEYSYTDRPGSSGTIYYRLTQKDFNGTKEVFPLIAVEFELKDGECTLTVFPNPCTPECKIVMNNCPENADGNVLITVMDATGNVVHTKAQTTGSDGSFVYSLDQSSGLKPGVYIIRGTSSRKTYQQKAIIK
ncbi:MAG: hypothetical protein Fur0041_05500 [Bacteroidia bacterium]